MLVFVFFSGRRESEDLIFLKATIKRAHNLCSKGKFVFTL